MKLSDFLKDRVFVFMSFSVAFVMIFMFMTAFHIQTELIVMVSVILCLFAVTAETWEFCRKKNFYEDMLSKLDGLDRKYLISEILANPSFYEGRLICEVLQESNRSMCESVAEYRRKASDFREFIEMWVHEIKLPVSSLQLMMHNHKSELGSKAFEQLRRIDGYTDTVLYYARSENAEKDYLIKDTSLKRIVSNAAVKNREDLLLHDVQLQTEKLDVSVMTDSKWLEFILGQLLANSMKFISNERKSMVTIWAEDFPDRTMLHFWDNGIGIPESDLPYIFEKSFTGENGRLHAKSTGMGLYIVKSLCGRLGHDIAVKSVAGDFTEFVISFGKNDFYKFE